MTLRVGIIGTGRMGLPILSGLVAAGFRVTAFDSRPECEVAATALGAGWSDSARELAESVDVLITVLPGAPELREVMLAGQGALAGMGAGSCWLDLTSNDPEVAAEIAALAAERNIGVVGAPMGGGVSAAQAGSLVFYVGAEQQHLRRVRPLLAALGGDAGIVHVGTDIRAGYLVKLLINLLWFGQAVATTEALLLGSAMGLSVSMLRETFAGSAAGSAFISRDLDALLVGDYLESFGIDRVVDELAIVTALACTRGVPFELSSVVLTSHRQALERFGPVDGELLAAKLLEERAQRVIRVEA